METVSLAARVGTTCVKSCVSEVVPKPTLIIKAHCRRELTIPQFGAISKFHLVVV